MPPKSKPLPKKPSKNKQQSCGCGHHPVIPLGTMKVTKTPKSKSK